MYCDSCTKIDDCALKSEDILNCGTQSEHSEQCPDCPTDCTDMWCMQETIEHLKVIEDDYGKLSKAANHVADTWLSRDEKSLEAAIVALQCMITE